MDSAVTVTPAPSGDVSKDLHARAAPGAARRSSGSADQRPADDAAGAAAGRSARRERRQRRQRRPTSSAGGRNGRDLLARRAAVSALQPALPAGPDLRRRRAGRRTRSPTAASSARFLHRRQPARRLRGDPAEPRQPCQALGEHGAVYYPRAPGVEALAGRHDPDAEPAAVRRRRRRDGADRRRRAAIWKAPAGLEAGIAGASGLTEPHRRQRLRASSTRRASTCCATFPGAGMVVWGARTLKGDDTPRRSSSTSRSAG